MRPLTLALVVSLSACFSPAVDERLSGPDSASLDSGFGQWADATTGFAAGTSDARTPWPDSG